MEQILMKVLSEGGVIQFLFTLIVWGFIWKGVPYLLKKFDDVVLTFANSLKELQETHRKDMETISAVFLAQIKESNLNHQITQNQIKEFSLIHNETAKNIQEIKDFIKNNKL